jgi:hypothetical protein
MIRALPRLLERRCGETGDFHTRRRDRYLVNATTQRLAVKMGAAEPVVIEPGKAGLLRIPVGEEVIIVYVRIGVEKDGGWDLASTEI